ncbi:hypothetical protein [Micromonospora sp. SH-82]|uniref:hypothetical protein n=1 Tax=Micromonospora sp. SH-82 TaxID=3132938 RepID=UPI003EBC98DC
MKWSGSMAPDGETPPAQVRRVTSVPEAGELARRLQVSGRRWPVVVVTSPAGYDDPFGDPDEIKNAVGDLAEVALMPTGEVSWAFSREMPPATQVYGGAGRVYPVDMGWVNFPERSRLRFAYSPQDRRRITDQLISDALQAALAAGLVEQRPTRAAVAQRSGRVQGTIGGSRAFVTLDDSSLAMVWEELTVPGVALDRILVKGQSVTGGFDPASRRLDLRGGLRFVDPADAVAGVGEAYQVGDVVLAEVTTLHDDRVTVRLLPGLAVDVPRDAVTSNPNDQLRNLFSVGEVVTCRLVEVEPVRLRLDDVDDEEVPAAAPSLLPGGPPWLRPPDPEAALAPQVRPRPGAAAPSTPPTQGPAATPGAPATSGGVPRGASPRPMPPPGRRAAPVAQPAPVVAPRQPTPLDVRMYTAAQQAATMRPAPTESADPVSGTTRVPAADQARFAQLIRQLAAEKAALGQVRKELDAERSTRRALGDDLTGLRTRAAELEEEMASARVTIESLQTRYRKADQARQKLTKELKSLQSRTEQASADGPLFLDPQEQFRHEVLVEWAQRIPAADKAARPLAPYEVGSRFLDSIEKVGGVSRAKVVAVVVEVLTGQAQNLDGRDLHRLRTGSAGSPYVRRDDDAICWRVALQRESAAARRLHYWQIGDRYELSRVVLHDDYQP